MLRTSIPSATASSTALAITSEVPPLASENFVTAQVGLGRDPHDGAVRAGDRASGRRHRGARAMAVPIVRIRLAAVGSSGV